MRANQVQSAGCTEASVETGLAVPRAVAQAIQYMRNHLTVPLSVGAIAAACSTPERTLRRQFRRFTGKSPVAFHRKLRLDAVHRALREENAEIDVTTAAAAFGFSQLGRFTEQYRQCFGGLPSETLRARRQVLLQLPLGVHDSVNVAVFPFAAVNRRFDEMALADSTTEGVIAALGRLRGLNVIAPPHGSAAGQTRLIAPHHAQYAVHGRVQSFGSGVQVIVKLSEVATGRHIWGDAFDAVPENALALREKVIERVAGAVPAYFNGAGVRPVGNDFERDPFAVELIKRAFHSALEMTKAANAQALVDIDRVRSIDREYPLAIALDACCKAQRAIYFFGSALDAQRDEVRHLTSLALSMDNQDPLVLAVLGWAASVFCDLDLGETLIEKSLAIQPRCGLAWQRRGWIATYRRDGTAFAHFKQALMINPNGRERFNTMLGLSQAYFDTGDYGRAADWAVRGLRERPSETWACRFSAVALEHCGQRAEARHSVLRLRGQYPDISVTSIIRVLPMQAEIVARTAEALESAGMPL
jgi:TolB-like protein